MHQIPSAHGAQLDAPNSTQMSDITDSNRSWPLRPQTAPLPFSPLDKQGSPRQGPLEDPLPSPRSTPASPQAQIAKSAPIVAELRTNVIVSQPETCMS